MLDPPFLTDLPVRRIITSRLPCRNTVGITSQISPMSRQAAFVKLLRGIVCVVRCWLFPCQSLNTAA